jgi:multidrug efflux pump subunit AcrA (membrane-fusion protein)
MGSVMSSVPSQESVEQTKRQIRTLVQEISDMSKGDAAPAEFYPSVLQRIVQALVANGGAIWLVEDDKSLKLAYHISMEPELLEVDGDSAGKHLRLLRRIAQKGEGELIPPMTVFGEQQAEANPTRHLLVVCPFGSGKQLVGLIEIFQRPDAPPDTQRGYLKFVDHMSKLMGDWVKGQSLQRVSDRQLLWQQSDEFARHVHENLDLRDTAYAIANEGRRLIECDRVGVAILRGGKAKVIAISGQDAIENRSNIISSLNQLSTRVIKSGETLWYDGSTDSLPPQLEEAVEDYVDLSHSKNIVVLPIRRPEYTIEGDVQAKETKTTAERPKEIIGALIVEQIESSLDKDTLQGRIDLVYEHSARALSNSLVHNDLFLMPVWRALSRATWMFRGSALPKTLAILGTALAALIGMFLIKIDFDLKGNGILKPVVERQVFAHVDGEIDQVLVEHGSVVRANQPLVTLKNRDLEQQIADLQGQLEVTLGRLNVIPYEKANSTRLTDADLRKLESEEAELAQRKISLESQLAILNEKAIQLVRRSPIDGIVTTWDVEKTLRARPVVAGQALLAVAKTDGQWELEISMPEKRMKYLDEAIAKASDGHLPVDFILMTNPSQQLSGKLSAAQIHQRAEVAEEEGTVVKLRVQPDSMDGLTRPGSKVIADVKCGRANAAFVWFHEVIEWIRANLLF